LALVDYRVPVLVDCDCGLRYLRSGVATAPPQIGHFKCRCGQVIGAWHGDYLLVFEPEDDETGPQGA